MFQLITKTFAVLAILSIGVYSEDKLVTVTSAAETETTENTSYELLNELQQMFLEESNLIPSQYSNYFKPKRRTVIWILTSWRSGSSFLGKVLGKIPGRFYTYEPFRYIKALNWITATHLPRAHNLTHKILQCRFDQLEDFKFRNPLELNPGICKQKKPPHPCMESLYMRGACLMMPVHLIKTVRMSAQQAQFLFGITDINLKIIHLIRDPRAVYNSRLARYWCTFTACIDMATHCQRLQGDIEIVQHLEKEYPRMFRTIRYEDIVKDPEAEFSRLFEFLDVPYLESIAKYVHELTNTSKAETWRQKLDPSDIYNVTKHCDSVLRHYYYDLV